MQRKTQVFWLVLGVVLLSTILVLKFNKRPGYKIGTSPQYDSIIRNSIKLYQTRAGEGMEFSKGPCLTNDLMRNWVVDTVHNPREPVDDLPENQCQAFREGRATHFVELDINGNLVRIK